MVILAVLVFFRCFESVYLHIECFSPTNSLDWKATEDPTRLLLIRRVRVKDMTAHIAIGSVPPNMGYFPLYCGFIEASQSFLPSDGAVV